MGVRPRDKDDFFGLGGGSMELVMLLMAVEDRLGVNMSMDELFTDEFTFGASVAAVTRALDAPR
ncbi:acyl carrier protein [Streptomyces drozdowiczii]|uniref:acyl carrier protein n=1 Tax=Streptomyces drozdowiczii TaxID=202862 RepID=UPI00223EA0F1|nr:acyl carrier protein [Streptomyces drozdowiczii]